MSKKFDADEAVQKYVEKKVAAALKVERKRITMGLDELPMPSTGSKKEVNAMRKALKQVVVASVTIQ